jgi:hypothetical protein
LTLAAKSGELSLELLQMLDLSARHWQADVEVLIEGIKESLSQ